MDYQEDIQTFKECYNDISTFLRSSTSNEMDFDNEVRIQINKAIATCNERGTFIHREQKRREESRNRAQRIDLDKLPVVTGAAFNSYQDTLDEAIRKRYEDGRLKIERLSGRLLPLECCFINLGIINHIPDGEIRSASNEEGGNLTKGVSKFSLSARLKVNIPHQAHMDALNSANLRTTASEKETAQIFMMTYQISYPGCR